MATLEVPFALAFSFNREGALKRMQGSLKSNKNFITFFIDLNESDRELLVSGLIERLEKSFDEYLISYYDQFKDSQVRNLIRVVLLTREDFVKKMNGGNFICTI